MKDDFESIPHRLEALCGELGYSIETYSTPKTSIWQAKILNQFQHTLFEVQAEELGNFVWLSRQISIDLGLRSIVGPRLADCAVLARHFGCALVPSTNTRCIELELGLPLFYTGLTYYALKEALVAIGAAADACLQMLDPSQA